LAPADPLFDFTFKYACHTHDLGMSNDFVDV
jgi:hypothetical protein